MGLTIEMLILHYRADVKVSTATTNLLIGTTRILGVVKPLTSLLDPSMDITPY